MKSKTVIAAAGASALFVFAQVASAHPSPSAAASVGAGVTHPFTGIDHILAMLAVGLCAAQIGGRALWILPGTFLAFMLAGGMLAVGGRHVPMAEQGIAASVVVLGLLIAMGSRSPVQLIAGLVALFAIFHGHAHGAEMHAGAAPLAYAVGFVIATASLHVIGIASGLFIRRSSGALLSRLVGSAIAVGGIALFW